MYKLRNDFIVPSKSLSENVQIVDDFLILKNGKEVLKYNIKEDKWYLTNEIVADMFMGYGCLPNFYTDKIDSEGFDELFEKIEGEVYERQI